MQRTFECVGVPKMATQMATQTANFCQFSANKKAVAFCNCLITRAESGTRTRDLFITSETLYHLSYFGNPLRWVGCWACARSAPLFTTTRTPMLIRFLWAQRYNRYFKMQNPNRKIHKPLPPSAPSPNLGEGFQIGEEFQWAIVLFPENICYICLWIAEYVVHLMAFRLLRSQ